MKRVRLLGGGAGGGVMPSLWQHDASSAVGWLLQFRGPAAHLEPSFRARFHAERAEYDRLPGESRATGVCLPHGPAAGAALSNATHPLL